MGSVSLGVYNRVVKIDSMCRWTGAAHNTTVSNISSAPEAHLDETVENDGPLPLNGVRG